jgi:pyridoxamine 5'-phosphate oxidase
MPSKPRTSSAVPREALNRFRRWFAAARRTRQPLPEAMALATADARGLPAVRFVLLKEADERGFVFYTNDRSRKGRELRENPRASLAFHWDGLRRQVRVTGRVETVSEEEANAYWATRPRESQLAALASSQSEPLAARGDLVRRWRELERRHRGADVPRPPHWGGYRVLPDEIEFWTNRDHRLHDRELFVRTRRGWVRRLLQP